jgi:Uma2 family endonuclease
MTATAPAPATKPQLCTVEEYFELEKRSEIRHEFVNGQLIPMPGESRIANRIADNCGFAMRLKLGDDVYDVVRHDVRAMVRRHKKYRYPDVALVKISDDVETHGMTKPEILIEVTSDGSSKTDHEDKVREYTALSSVQHYLIISQTELLVEIYSRDAQGWRFQLFDEMGDVIDFKNYGFTLSLGEIYKNVVFAEAKSDNEN